MGRGLSLLSKRLAISSFEPVTLRATLICLKANRFKKAHLKAGLLFQNQTKMEEISFSILPPSKDLLSSETIQSLTVN